MKYCVVCGCELPEKCSPGRKYCDLCYRERRRRKDRERFAERKAIKAAQEEIRKKPVKTLAEMAREAQAHGMSYGQWVSRIT